MQKLRLLAFAGAVGLAVLAVPAAAEENGFRGLRPGKVVVHEQDVPVRIVLIGFGSEVKASSLLSVLPARSRPVVRYPKFYGLEGRDLGLDFSFRYRVERKGSRFTDRFFQYLASIGTPGSLTAYQAFYNTQGKRGLDVTGPVLYIDGPSVERWLSLNDEGEHERGYTIYFVNWFGRPDFKFHVYTKTDEPDPDTGYNFGASRSSRKTVAWGGTSSRRWVYDFSAGPEAWGSNYDLDDDDLDGDGVADYRIPAIWDYAQGGYRDPGDLSSDMGLVARFVAIDLLFATSPLYDPLVTAPDPGGAKVAHVAMLEDDPAASGLDWFNRDFAKDKWRRFEPYHAWKVGLSDTSPIDAGAKNTLDIFAGSSADSGCWVPFGTTFAQMFCYFDQNKDAYVPRYRRRDYVGEIFAFNTTSSTSDSLGGLLGFADDNWVDGTQTYEFVFGSPDYREAGYGFTTTVVHEFGHHLGMSHPHDGYDPELDFDYGPGGDLYFAWLGDESDTVMHYLDLSTGFGRFDQDNMHRYELAGYLNWANALAGDILASAKARRARPALAVADRAAREALDAFGDWDYARGAEKAREAYSLLAQTADDLDLVSSALAASKRLAALGIGPRKDGCRPRPFVD